MYTLPVGSEINKETISQAIEHNEKQKKFLTQLHDYYSGNHPILQRKKHDTYTNQKLVTNHASYITDLCTAYLLGNPVDYRYMPPEGEKEIPDISPVVDHLKKQTIADIDHEIAINSSIFGYSYEYVYASGNDVHFKPLDPRHAIIVYDDSMDHNKLFAIIYESCSGPESERKYNGVMVVDKDTVYTYQGDDLTTRTEELHFFDAIPLIEYPNNSMRRGDFEDVTTLIDAYNILQSDRVNDKVQQVESLLMFKGTTISEDVMDEIKKYRAFSIDQEADASYISRNLSETEIQVLCSKIEADIHKIAKTPNLSDEKFVGNSSGVAIRYKLFVFEQHTLNKERYFERGLLERFRLINNYLYFNSKAINTDELWRIDAVFKRNLPQNDLETSQMNQNLKGEVSHETRIKQLSFVDDVKAEIEAVNAENLKAFNQEQAQFGTDQPSANGEEKINNNEEQPK